MRGTGVEVREHLAFTTLQALLWPLRDAVDELEVGQAELLLGILRLAPSIESWSLGPKAFGTFQLTVASSANVSTAMLKSGQLAERLALGHLDALPDGCRYFDAATEHHTSGTCRGPGGRRGRRQRRRGRRLP